MAKIHRNDVWLHMVTRVVCYRPNVEHMRNT